MAQILAMKCRIFILLAAASLVAGCKSTSGSNDGQVTLSGSSTGVVALIYHRFDERRLSTSVSPALFRRQMQYLRDNGFRVVSAKTAHMALQAGLSTDKWVVITIDDGYRSTLTDAHPILREFGYPYTLFINTDQIGGGFLTWDELAQLARDPLVSIGNHTHRHSHLPDLPMNEALQEIETAQRLIRERLGVTAEFFSYPYGEYTEELAGRVAQLGFLGSFSQHSGVWSRFTNPQQIPRFPVNDTFGAFRGLAENGFELKVHALPLEMRMISAHRVRPDPGQRRFQNLEFEIIYPLSLQGRLSCFFNGQPIRRLERSNSPNQFIIRDTLDIAHERRSKLICNQAQLIPGEPTRFRWAGFLFINPDIAEE